MYPIGTQADKKMGTSTTAIIVEARREPREYVPDDGRVFDIDKIKKEIR